MASKDKMTLILELKNKLFNSKLMQTKRKISATTDKMRGKINRLKVDTIAGFTAMKNEIPLFGRAMDLLGNPYVLLAAGLVSVTLLLGKATGEAKAFNHEFLQIKNLNLDKNTADIKAYKVQIRDASFEVGQNLMGSTKAFYDLQSATGTYGKDAVSIFKKVGKYSTATGAILGDSMNSTTKAMKAFGLGVNEIDAYLTSNAKTVQAGLANFKELAQVQAEFAGAAAGAGQSVDVANKIFAAFTTIAGDAKTAATMTKTAFIGLTQANTIKGLSDIGIKMYDATGNMRDLESILMDVTSRFKQMTPKEIDVLINKIGGPEGLRSMFTKLKTGADDFQATLNTFNNSKFDLDKAFKNAKNDATSLGDIVKNRFGVIMARLGEKTLPLVYSILKGIDNTLKFLYNNFDLFGDIIESVGIGIKYTAAIVGIFAIATNGAAIATGIFSTSLGLMTTMLYGIGTAIASIPIVGWIAAAITGIALLIKRTEGWKAQWISLKESLSPIFKFIQLHFTTLVNGIMIGINKLKAGFYQFKIAMGIGDKDANKKALQAITFDTERRKYEIQKAAREFQESTFKPLEWKLSWKKKKGEKEEAKSNSLLADSNTSLLDDSSGSGTLGSTAAGQINGASSASGGSSQRNITIHIDALLKGGINTQNTTIAHKTTEEIEEWFQEAMMRVIRNAEMS